MHCREWYQYHSRSAYESHHQTSPRSTTPHTAHGPTVHSPSACTLLLYNSTKDSSRNHPSHSPPPAPRPSTADDSPPRTDSSRTASRKGSQAPDPRRSSIYAPRIRNGNSTRTDSPASPCLRSTRNSTTPLVSVKRTAVATPRSSPC